MRLQTNEMQRERARKQNTLSKCTVTKSFSTRTHTYTLNDSNTEKEKINGRMFLFYIQNQCGLDEQKYTRAHTHQIIIQTLKNEQIERI